MTEQKIYDKWGSTYEFDNPNDFFDYPASYWRNKLYDRKLLVFKRMKISKENYAKMCVSFGRLWKEGEYRESYEKIEYVKVNDIPLIISPISNLISPKLGLHEMMWHADIPNKKDKPFPMRSIWMVKNPNPTSGLTSWLNIADGLKTLEKDLLDKVPNIKIIQQSWWKENTDLQEFDFIKTHPITKEKSLRLNFFCDQTKKITDAWIKEVKFFNELVDPKPILGSFYKFLEQQKELKYTHKWDDFDIVIYDNWSFVHNRTRLEFDPTLERLMYRTNIDHLDDNEFAKHEQFINIYLK